MSQRRRVLVLTPVTAGGATDPSRQVLDVGEAQLLTQVGAVPLAFEIEARSLGDAAEKCAADATVGVERAVKELQELRREAASPITVPATLAPGLGGPDRPRGSGTIQFP